MCSIYIKSQPLVNHGIDHPFHQMPLSQVVVFCSIKRMLELGRFFHTDSWAVLVCGILLGWIFFLSGFFFALSFLDPALEGEEGGRRSRGQSHEGNASAPQGAGNNAAPSTCSPSSLQSSGSGAPRSLYSRNEAPGDGDSDDEDAKKPPSGRNLTPRHRQQRADTTPPRRVHCPCFLRDPIRYRDCSNFRAKDWKDLREHFLSRRHQCIPYCAVCRREFKGDRKKAQDDWKTHTQKQFCQPQPEQPTTRITRAQEEKIMKLTRKGQKAKPLEDNWRSIWRILFDEAPQPASPYVSHGPLVLGSTSFSNGAQALSQDEESQQELINLPAMANVPEEVRIGVAQAILNVPQENRISVVQAVLRSLVSTMQRQEARGKGVQMIAEPSNRLSSTPHVSPTEPDPVMPQDRGHWQEHPTPSATTIRYATPGTSITRATNDDYHVEDPPLEISVPATAPVTDPGHVSSSGLGATSPPGETPPCPLDVAGVTLPPGRNENLDDWFGMSEGVGQDFLGMNFGAYDFSDDFDPSYPYFGLTDERVEGPSG